MFDRESKREKNLETRAKEMKLREKLKSASAHGTRPDKKEQAQDEPMKHVERDFWDTIKQVEGEEEARAAHGPKHK